MSTIKEEAKHVIDQLPDDVTWAEMLRELQAQQQLDGDAITERLNEVYAQESSKLDPVFERLQMASWPVEKW